MVKNIVTRGVVACYPIKQIIDITHCARPYTCSHTHARAHVRDGETGYVSLNGRECWRKTGITANEDKQVCGQNQPKNEASYPVACSIKLPGTGIKDLKIRVWTDLDEPTLDESFGIDNLVIRRELDTTRAPSE